MNEWYYAKARQQYGPVSLQTIRMMIRDGALDPAKDLVWKTSMPDWLPADQVPELAEEMISETAAIPPVSQPFAYPLNTGAIEEIEHGSESIMATACVKRAWDLTIRHIGPLILVTVIYLAITIPMSFLLAHLDKEMGWKSFADYAMKDGSSYEILLNDQLSIQSSIIATLLNVFLMLGATRIGLNLVSGKAFDVGMLFSGGRWLLKGLIAHYIYWIMVVCGLVLLIFPGIYLAIRFGMYQNAIVDRNMGVIDAFKYSSRITQNNRLELFVIMLFTIGIVIAGCFAFLVGLLFAYPMIFLMWIVAYRWLQYGGRAILDDPASGQPQLAGIEKKTDDLMK